MTYDTPPDKLLDLSSGDLLKHHTALISRARRVAQELRTQGHHTAALQIEVDILLDPLVSE